MFQAYKSILRGGCFKRFKGTITVKMIKAFFLQSLDYHSTVHLTVWKFLFYSTSDQWYGILLPFTTWWFWIMLQMLVMTVWIKHRNLTLICLLQSLQSEERSICKTSNQTDCHQLDFFHWCNKCMKDSFICKARLERKRTAHYWQKAFDLLRAKTLLPFAAVLHFHTAGQCEHGHNEWTSDFQE